MLNAARPPVSPQGKGQRDTVLSQSFPHKVSRIGTRCNLSGYCARFLGSSMVEHAAVNRRVVGSSPTRGAALQLSGQTRVVQYKFLQTSDEPLPEIPDCLATHRTTLQMIGE